MGSDLGGPVRARPLPPIGRWDSAISNYFGFTLERIAATIQRPVGSVQYLIGVGLLPALPRRRSEYPPSVLGWCLVCLDGLAADISPAKLSWFADAWLCSLTLESEEDLGFPLAALAVSEYVYALIDDAHEATYAVIA